MRAVSSMIIVLMALIVALLPARAGAGTRIRSADGGDLVRETVRKASRLQQAGQTDEAISVVSKAVDEAEGNHQAQRLRTIEVNLRLRRVLEAGKGQKELVKTVDTLLDNSAGVDREKAHLFCARVNARIGRYQRSKALLNQYLEEFPEPSQRELRQFRQTARKRRGASAGGQMTHPRLLYRYWATQVLWKVSLVGEPVPDFRLTTLDGQTVTPESFKGDVLLINVWKSASPPSTHALRGLDELYRARESDDLAVLGLSLDRTEAALRSFLKKNELPWPQVYVGDKRQEITDRFFVQTIPSTYLVDREGILRGVDLRGTVLRHKLEQILSR